MNKRSSWYVLTLCVLSIALSVAGFYTWPDRVPIHWNFAGDVDGYASRTVAAVFYPGLLLVLYALFRVLPALDPQRERYAEFRPTYDLIISAIMTVLFLVGGVASLAAWEYAIPIQYVVPGLIGVLFIILGNYMGKLKRNYFVGVRTPWTLASENVWLATQRFSGKLFMLCGVCFFVVPLLPQVWGVSLFIVCIVALIGGSFGYSYWKYKGEVRGERVESRE